MIKVSIFDGTDMPIQFISDATIHDFLEWSSEGNIVALTEKDTNALFTIPFLKYPLKIENIVDE